MNALHPQSVLVGLGAAGLAFFTATQATPPPATPTPVGIARIEYFARPQDMVQIREGSEYVVPSGKLLVLTAVGSSDTGYPIELRANGELTLGLASAGELVAIGAVRPFSAGTSLEVSSPNPFDQGDARVCGYLDRATPAPTDVLRLRYTAQPSQFVEVRQGAALTVPPGKLFVLTSQGPATVNEGVRTELRVNGQVENTVTASLFHAVDVPFGIVVQSGSVIEAFNVWLWQEVPPPPPTPDGRVWGYLANQ